MKKAALAVLMYVYTSLTSAAVINVEFKFTPFTGNAKQDEQVTTVAGKARVYLNNIFLAEQEVRQEKVPVLFEAREIAPSVWVPVASIGPALRRGRNSIRFDFEPGDAKASYRAQLRWAVVNDEATEQRSAGQITSTNQSGEGVEEKAAAGKLSMAREFDAPFATEYPWHRAPAVTALSSADRQALEALVKARADSFRPPFEGVYAALKTSPQIKVEDVRKSKCLDKAYAAGVRIDAPTAGQLDATLTGNAEVVLRSTSGDLFRPADPAKFQKIKGEEARMCAGMALYSAFPPRMVVARNPAGDWEAVY
jgi:hypothetical protein